MKLTKVTELDLQGILNNLYSQKSLSANQKTRLSKDTITKVRSLLQQAFQTADRLNLISTNPTIHLKVPQNAPKKDVKPLNHEQQERLKVACSDDKLGCLFMFLLNTGLRREELVNLSWQDYDPINKTIFVKKSKTKAGVRQVYLLAEANEIILSQPHTDEFIFHNTLGRKLSPSSMRRLYERLRKKANIPFLTNHVMRHTFVTNLCEKKNSAKAISQIIGHANSKYVLDIYASLETDELRKSIFSLETPQIAKSKNEELILEIPNELYQNIVRVAFNKGLPINEYILHEMRLLCRH